MSVTGTVPIIAAEEASEVVFTGRQADEDISKYDLVYFEGTKIKKADASSSNTMPVYGMAKETIADGEEGDIWAIAGTITNDDWAFSDSEIGKDIFADTVPGGLTTTPPSSSGNVVQRLGRVLAVNKIQFDPDETYFNIA